MPSMLFSDPEEDFAKRSLLGLTDAPDDSALGSLWNRVVGRQQTPDNPIWARDNPIGTERLHDQSLSMPSGPFDPITPGATVSPGAARPLTVGEYQGVQQASEDLFNQAGALETGGPGVPGQRMFASRRPAAGHPPTRAPLAEAPPPPVGLLGTAAPGGEWFHGTSSKFDTLNTPEVYLTNHPGQAAQYAQNVHRLGQEGAGEPQVLMINPKPGHVQNIDDHLFDAMDQGDDVGDAIESAIAAARKQGHARYLEYTHPNAGDQGDHTVRISLYPQHDLTLGGGAAPGEAGTQGGNGS